MSDVSQGPGWWQASDGKWYAPQQAAGGAPDPGLGTPAAGGPAAAATGPGGAPLAEWATRAIGIVIDWAIGIVLFLAFFIVGLILGAISNVLGFLFDLVGYFVVLAYWLYLGYLVGTKGQSPGMAIQGITCIGEETGALIGGGQGVIRTLAHFIDSLICYIGWLFPLWDPKKQTISDKLLKTLVVTGAPKKAFSVDLFKA